MKINYTHLISLLQVDNSFYHQSLSKHYWHSIILAASPLDPYRGLSHCTLSPFPPSFLVSFLTLSVSMRMSCTAPSGGQLPVSCDIGGLLPSTLRLKGWLDGLTYSQAHLAHLAWLDTIGC